MCKKGTKNAYIGEKRVKKGVKNGQKRIYSRKMCEIVQKTDRKSGKNAYIVEKQDKNDQKTNKKRIYSTKIGKK